MPRSPFRHRSAPLLLILVLCLLTAGASLAAAEAPRLTVDDVVALLKAGVGEPLILRQAAATGTHMSLSVDDMLRLKAAGASDDLIASLMQEPSAEADNAIEGFRIFTETTLSGEKVIHITNLDAVGRRIGGEVERPAPRNVVAGADSSAPDRATLSPEPPAPAETNVYVEVYPPEPGLEPEPSTTPLTLGGYGGLYPGYLPGYLSGYYPVSRYHRGAGRARLVGPGWSPYSPPGSWSHFERYHHRMTAPYRSDTAAGRNRATFRRH